MNIKIVTDSTCDLPTDVVEKHDIEVIPLYIHIGEQSYLDGVELSRADFYQQLPNYSTFPTTATPGPEAFRAVYQTAIEQGAEHILSIHIAESLSATLNSARLAAEEITDIPVTVVDSRQLSLGVGFMVEAAAKARDQGAVVEEILPLLEDYTMRTHVFAALETMEFLKRSGRVNGLVAGLGSVLQIKPLLKMYNGEPTSERVRTSNGAFKRLIQLVEDKAPLERIALVHTHAAAKADNLLQEIGEVLPQGEIHSVDITPVIGAHIGPGAVGFATVTERLETE